MDPVGQGFHVMILADQRVADISTRVFITPNWRQFHPPATTERSSGVIETFEVLVLRRRDIVNPRRGNCRCLGVYIRVLQVGEKNTKRRPYP